MFVRVHADLGSRRGSGQQQSGNDGDGEQGDNSAHRGPNAATARFLRRWMGTPFSVRGAPFYVALCLLLLFPGTAAAASAPGAPGEKALWTEADKDGFGTATAPRSKVWHTLDDGELTEVYYPDIDTPAFRDLQFVVSDGKTFAERETREREARDLARRQALADLPPGQHATSRYQIVKTYVTDPARNALVIDVKLHLAHRQEARALRARRPGALQRRRRRLGHAAPARALVAQRRRRRPRRSSPHRPSRAPRAATSARATAGPTCARTSAWTGTYALGAERQRRPDRPHRRSTASSASGTDARARLRRRAAPPRATPRAARSSAASAAPRSATPPAGTATSAR